MDELVRVEIEVTQEAAAALKDEQRGRSVGRMVSELFSQKTTDDRPLRLIFAEIKKDARDGGLTNREIDAELSRHIVANVAIDASTIASGALRADSVPEGAVLSVAAHDFHSNCPGRF
jgi:hypothetical protein